MSEFKQFCLQNDDGTRVIFSELGASIRSFVCRDRRDQEIDIVLGFDTDAEYFLDTTFMGAVVGPYANRIKHGRFKSTTQNFQLDVDGNGHTLHGARAGVHAKHWRGQCFASSNSVWFTLELQDGEGGFPGNRRLEVRYQLIDSDLRISYSCITDQDTIINLTQHSYFNLAGHASGSIENTEFCILADQITEVDRELIPTGKILSVVGTPLDFLQPASLGPRLRSNHQLLEVAQGFDHNYVLHKRSNLGPGLVATARSRVSGIELQVLTDRPGLQFYCGTHIPKQLPGKKGAVYNALQGFCLETQNYPDAPNHPNFPAAWVRAGDVWRSDTVYRILVHGD